MLSKIKETDKGTALYSIRKSVSFIENAPEHIRKEVDRALKEVKKLGVIIRNVTFNDDPNVVFPYDITTEKGKQVLRDAGLTEKEIENARQEDFRIFGRHIGGETDGEKWSDLTFFQGANSEDVWHEFTHAYDTQKGLPSGWEGYEEHAIVIGGTVGKGLSPEILTRPKPKLNEEILKAFEKYTQATVPSVDITPQMKADVLEKGQPMFKPFDREGRGSIIDKGEEYGRERQTTLIEGGNAKRISVLPEVRQEHERRVGVERQIISKDPNAPSRLREACKNGQGLVYHPEGYDTPEYAETKAISVSKSNSFNCSVWCVGFDNDSVWSIVL